jgi:hemerythrin
MALLSWSDKLSVGVPEMDQQHRRLVDLINQLYDAMQMGKGDHVKSAVLNDLLTYTKVHFAAEERLMQKHAYPHLVSHKRLHDELTGQVLQLKDKLQTGQMVASVTLANFLKDWLQKHITQEDRKYGQFICQTATV